MLLDTVEGSQVYLAQAPENAGGLRIVSPRRMAASLFDPRSVDWADPGHLVVVAADRNAQPQPFEVSLSGPIEPLAPVLAGITEASVAFGQPMIAASKKNRSGGCATTAPGSPRARVPRPPTPADRDHQADMP